MRNSQQSDETNLAELRAFVAVAETGAFVVAARRLGKDATVLSRRISALEARLGVRLIERTTRSMALTEAGRSYLQRAGAILAALETAEAEAAGFSSGKPRGRLRLALPGSFGRLWLAPILIDFLSAYPDISIEAEFSNRFVDLVGEGFDLAVRLGELEDSRLVARKIADRRRLVCAAPDYLEDAPPLRAPEDLAAHPCLIFSGLPSPNRWDFTGPDGTLRRVWVRGPLTSDDAEVLATAAVAGRGLVLTTDWLAAPDLAAGRLVPVLEAWRCADEGAIYVVTPSGFGSASKTQAFANWLTERFRSPPWMGN
jgi:DNA-binding transcriptional LysR family regulator